MAKLNKTLIQRGISKVAKTKKQVTLQDGDGLELRLGTKNLGRGQWVLQMCVNGERFRLHLGYYDHNNQDAGMTITEARAKALEAKMNARNQDMKIVRGVHRNYLSDGSEPIEKYVYEHYWVAQSKKSASKVRSAKATVELLEKAKIIDKPADHLNMQNLLPYMRDLYGDKPGTARLICQELAIISRGLSKLYDTQVRMFDPKLVCGVHKIQSRVGVPIGELDTWFENLKTVPKESAASMVSILLTLCRPNESIGIVQEWIDPETNAVTIPAEKMKCRRDHLIPITPLFQRVLNYMLEHGSYTYNFIARHFQRTRPRDEYTLHGFRSIGATALHEKFGDMPHIVERCLAHETKGRIEKVYNRYNYLDEMRTVRNGWEELLTEQTKIVAFIEYLEDPSQQPHNNTPIKLNS